jgi:predicted transcriptional regulator of viral defense system
MVLKLREWQVSTLEKFEELAKGTRRVYTREQLFRVLDDLRDEGVSVPVTWSQERFLDFLSSHEAVRKVQLEAEPPTPRGWVDRVSYKTFTRYIAGEASPYEVALSLRGGSYLSHASAVFLHGLTTQIPRTIYANKEQSPKPSPTGKLTQEGITRAFSNAPRTSQYVYTYEGTRIVLLSGKNSGALETTDIVDPNVIPIRATKLERTLIDITVRPNYAGGVFDVLEAYRSAKTRSASVATLIATLKQLKYIYPYHQAMGFYLQRAGYPQNQLDRVRALGMTYDFYLSYKMPDPQYDPEWRIYYPQGL